MNRAGVIEDRPTPALLVATRLMEGSANPTPAVGSRAAPFSGLQAPAWWWVPQEVGLSDV